MCDTRSILIGALVSCTLWQVHGPRSLSGERVRMPLAERKLRFVRARDSMSMTRDTTMDNQSRFCSGISASLESLCTSLAALGTAPKGQGMWRDRYTNILLTLSSFFVSVTRLRELVSLVVRDFHGAFRLLRASAERDSRMIRFAIRIHRERKCLENGSYLFGGTRQHVCLRRCVHVFVLRTFF